MPDKSLASGRSISQGDTVTHDGPVRMRSLIETLKMITPLVEPDVICPTPKRGATASWGKAINLFMEIGPAAKDGGMVYVLVFSGGQPMCDDMKFNYESKTGDYGQVLDAIKGVMPHVLKEREAETMQKISTQSEAILRETLPVPENPFLTALRGLSPEDKAVAYEILRGA